MCQLFKVVFHSGSSLITKKNVFFSFCLSADIYTGLRATFVEVAYHNVVRNITVTSVSGRD